MQNVGDMQSEASYIQEKNMSDFSLIVKLVNLRHNT